MQYPYIGIILIYINVHYLLLKVFLKAKIEYLEGKSRDLQFIYTYNIYFQQFLCI